MDRQSSYERGGGGAVLLLFAEEWGGRCDGAQGTETDNRSLNVAPHRKWKSSFTVHGGH
jgi:hypothetical protein